MTEVEMQIEIRILTSHSCQSVKNDCWLLVYEWNSKSYSTPPNSQGSWNCGGHACQGFPTNDVILAISAVKPAVIPFFLLCTNVWSHIYHMELICLTACDLWLHCTVELTMMDIRSHIIGLDGAGFSSVHIILPARLVSSGFFSNAPCSLCLDSSPVSVSTLELCVFPQWQMNSWSED